MGRTAKDRALVGVAEPIRFEPDGAVLSAFLHSQGVFDIIKGPIGSGKTRAAIMRMLKHCGMQPVQRDGKRRSRWAVVRETYPELRSTTIAAFLDLFPDGTYGNMVWTPPYTYHFKMGDIEAEFVFLAVEKPEDAKKLRSAEYTGVYWNELQYSGLDLVGEAVSRTGRYPAVKDGGCSWSGFIADMNAPENAHWTAIMFGEVPVPEFFTESEVRQHQRPDDWTMYKQPPALLEERDDEGRITGYVINPQAENLKWLPADYYARQIKGKARSWIDANLMNRSAAIQRGRSVHPLFNPDRHVARSEMKFNPELDLYVGLDFGLTPAAIFGQSVRGRVFVLHELYAEDVGSVTFAPMVRQVLAQKFRDAHPGRVFLYGDPSGGQRGQADEKTPFQIFQQFGLKVIPAPGSNRMKGTQGRKEVMDNVLNRHVDGYPAFLLDPSCRMLIAGFGGGYQYKDVRTAAGLYKSDEIVKNKYSHPVEACHYLVLGMGEGRELFYGGKKAVPVRTKTAARVFDRGPRKSVWRGQA